MFFTLTRLRFLSLWGLFSLIGFHVVGQIEQTNRREFPITRDIEAHAVVTVDTLGLILYRTYSGPKQNSLELTRLDTALRQAWTGFLSVPKEFTFTQVKANQSRIYFLFKGNTIKKGYMVYSVSILDGGYFYFQVNNAIPFDATEFIVNRESLLIAGYFNYRPIIVHFSITTNQTRALPGLLNARGEIMQIKSYPDGSIDIIISAKNSTGTKCIWIHHYNAIGDMIKTVILEPEENKNLIFGRAAQTSSENQLIAGVYGKNAGYARGIFVAEINPYGEYALHYYNFADLQNFFHYLKAPREKRIKARIERRKIKGKKNKFNYRFLVHEVIPYEDQFIMLGEAFFPRYNQRNYNPARFTGPGNLFSPWTIGIPTRYTYDSYGNMTFDGFQYTHAVVIGFDRNANLLWDNSFQINGVISFRLEQFVKILKRKDHLTLSYVFENIIRSKDLRGKELMEGTYQDPIKTYDGNEIVKNSTHNVKLEYWYGNHLFVYGIQDIKTKGVTGKVFFINKLTGS